jgi:pantetheine-phosphate adenylyltransferase
MRIAVYPGTFNPFHEGHADVLEKASYAFDRIIVAIGINPTKGMSVSHLEEVNKAVKSKDYGVDVMVDSYTGLLADYVKDTGASAVIRGLRNAEDFEYEKITQYWNEDLGITVPTFYVVSDRKLVHLSSSAIKALEMFKNKR